MISYEQFKKIFDSISANREPEIEIYFDNYDHTYMIIKYPGYITYQRCGSPEEQSGEIEFSTLDELYNSKTIDGIILKNDWKHIENIIFDNSFSVVGDLEYLLKYYGVQL